MSPCTISSHYPVAIVGGGVAGLTLALGLEAQGIIHYVLIEAHDSLAPDEGASIGLLPNGLRIFDQLGLIDEIEKHTSPLQRWRHLDGEGELISETNALGYYPSQIGYGGLFLERRKLLQIMTNKLKNHGAIITSTRVSSLEETTENVALKLSGGSYITADIVIGADGVRSRVREEIDRSQPGPSVHSDDYINVRFACVYGISPPIDGISEGECFSVYRPEAAILIFTGQAGIIFWFVFEDLGQTYELSKSPRYTKADIDSVCQSVAHLRISSTVCFGDVYTRRSVAMKVSLEEGVAPTWHSHRMVIVGDAAHKSTPNAAMGANQAIESATVLLNELQGVWNKPEEEILSSNIFHDAFGRYAERRKPRTGMIVQRAGITCRAQLGHDGPVAAVRQELPSLTDDDWLFRGFMGFSDSPVLAGVPLSPRGEFFHQAVEQFQERFRARQNGQLKVSNSGLFGNQTQA